MGEKMIENLEGEIWKPVDGYEGVYEISNMGRVKSLKRKHVKEDRVSKQNKKHTVIQLTKNNKKFIAQIDHLVAQAFIPNPENKIQIKHIDGNIHNNYAKNIEWIAYENLDGEIWKPVKGFEGAYEISSKGRIKSLKRLFVKEDRVTEGTDNGHGYLAVSLSYKGKHKKSYAHILVAEAFIPNPENKPEVNHKDGIKANNYYSNLEWNTSSENKYHCFEMGLHIPRQHQKDVVSNYMSKGLIIVNKDTLEIKKYKNLYDCSKDIGVPRSSISSIVNKYSNWNHTDYYFFRPDGFTKENLNEAIHYENNRIKKEKTK